MVPEAMARMTDLEARDIAAEQPGDAGLRLLRSVMAFALRDCASLLELVQAAWPMITLARQKLSTVASISARFHEASSSSAKRPTPGHLPESVPKPKPSAASSAAASQDAPPAGAAASQEAGAAGPVAWESILLP
jgi:hypothetical protein